MMQPSGVGSRGTGAVAAPPVEMRFSGSIGKLAAADLRALFDRSTSSDDEVRSAVARIVARVRVDGDSALREMGAEFDGVALEDLEVPRAEWERALATLDPSVRAALERSARNVASVHRASLPQASEFSPEPGIVVGRRPDPLGRVGVYAPGGRAAYPSSVLMGAVPARVAGVAEVVLCSPPLAATGRPSGVVLAAAAIAGVDRVFAVGGAGAIAAMAYGTESIPRADRIVGPGNAYVAEAKLQVAGAVAIDAPAGPSEVLIIADPAADPQLVARELLGQAEHDPLACAVVVIHPESAGEGAARAAERAGDDDGGCAAAEAFALRVADAMTTTLESQPRSAIIRESLARNGGILVAASTSDAVRFANEYAPEHLVLLSADRDAVLPRLRNAGTIFVGPSSSNAFGDYMTGANHVLPTGGLARSYSGLSVLDYFRWTTWQRVSADAAAALAHEVGVLADAEGLPGHAAAARALAAVEESR